ncbi:JAB domain-containing protein [Treponema zuelzerae]|uniref:JAB domain-containing protein n=1 Tax=Teretinema zuelzerae TaxID=156 RepID=A0AAE3JJG9_9SPIR|nr:JAB domain-containing protein [Teretinema zuelzerae]MCD1655513.1 JAB domain-containing protein [Teretinema zuelzerae]
MRYDVVADRKGPDMKIGKAEDVWKATERFHRARKEHFLVLTLNGAHEVIRLRIITIGIANRCLVHPREVFTPALQDGAVAVILAHNHPSGQLDASEEDKSITKRLVEAGQVLGIPVLDHLIVTKGGWFSFLESGLL